MKSKADKIKEMKNAFTLESLEKMLNTSSEDDILKLLQTIIDITAVIIGPEKWDNADPATIAVKVPKELLTFAGILRDNAGINTAEFLEKYFERLIKFGLHEISKNIHVQMQEILGILMKK